MRRCPKLIIFAFLSLHISFGVKGGTFETEISLLINSGQYREAIELFYVSDPDRAEELFFWGRLFKAYGDIEKAHELFSMALVLSPNYVEARLEYEHTVILLTESGTPPKPTSIIGPNTAAFSSTLFPAVDRADTSATSNQNFVFEIISSTNANRGANSLVFDTVLGKLTLDDPSMLAKPDTGLRLGINGSDTFPVGGQQLILDWEVSHNNYFGTTPDYTSLSASAKVPFQFEHFTLTPFLSGQVSFNRYSAKYLLTEGLSLKYPIGQDSMFIWTTQASNGWCSGPTTCETTSVSHRAMLAYAPTGGHYSAEFAIESTVNSQEHAHNAFAEYGITSRLYYKFDQNLGVELAISAKDRSYDAPFPLLGQNRHDTSYSISLAVDHLPIEVVGFSPGLKCTRSINRSNVSFLSYADTTCSLTFEKSF